MAFPIYPLAAQDVHEDINQLVEMGVHFCRTCSLSRMGTACCIEPTPYDV